MVNFPTSLDTLTNPLGTDDVSVVDHASQHSNANDILEALEGKVGINNSAVTTSIDYLLKSTSSVSPGHKHNATDIADGSVSNTEFQYLGNVTSDIQTQLNGKEVITNKATSFAVVNDTLYPSVQAVKTYADSLVIGLLDYRGAYDASVNTFPASGGSGTAGAVLKGDMWIISVAGTLGGEAVQIGDSVIANVDTPGQTASNWNILNANISYVPENSANKVTSLSGASTDTQYPSAKLTYDQLALKQATISFGTGVQTALGVNVGTAGAFVVNGGALGTPSSGTVTNLTGTASININGTVGATTPASGSFTTGAFSSDIDVTTNANTFKRLLVVNNSTGTAGDAGVILQNSAYTFFIGLPSTGYTTSGLKVANTAYFYGDAPGGINIGSTAGGGDVRIYNRGGLLALTFGDTQAATFTGIINGTTSTMSGVAAMTTAAESWIGPSSTTGVYFKGGNVGIGTTNPQTKLSLPALSAISFEASAGVTDIALTHSADTLTFSGGTFAMGANSITMTGSLGATGARATKLWATDIESTNMPTVGGVAMITISSADTLSNKTLTAPKFADLGFLADANGNELLILDTVASAVNELTLANAATAGNPTITASGGDANVGIDFVLKGTGTLNIKGNATQAAELRLYEDTDAGTNFTAFKVGTQAGDITYTLPTAVGAAGTFLKDAAGDGVLSWAAAGGSSIPTLDFSTIFETSGRFTNGVGGSGSITYGSNGVLLNTSSGTTSYCDWNLNTTGLNNVDMSLGNPQFSAALGVLTAPSAGDSYWGIGLLTVAGTGITYTGDQMGFKALYTASTLTLSATNANGTTETATDITSGITITNEIFWHAIKSGTTNVKFYLDRVLKATHTTNLPNSTAGSNVAQIATSNRSTDTQWRLRASTLNIKIDMQ